MQREYKELLITDEMDIARAAKAKGRYVVLCYPVTGITQQDQISDYPYAIENIDELDENYLDHVICRMKGIPCDILDTTRCHIREITIEDVDRLYEIYSKPGITKYMEGLYEVREDEISYTKDYIQYHYGFYDFGMWIIEEKTANKMIGRAGFDMREGYDAPELGFMIAQEYQRRGYATEVCEGILAYGREQLGFSVVGAFTDLRNVASVKLLEKLGFIFEREEYVTTVKQEAQKLAYFTKRW